ncbi:MAG: phospho-N-acetylmuramoyl-pentapeptide-transferase, partial [Bacteroidetes bacterium]|nr:phospho-N-acetylmuramoyl-pentapeptide-transferase [Bacteroidota bacterium]
MLYHLFKAIDFSIPGSGAFNYITFRAGMALFVSLVITLWFGKGIINALRRMQVGETVRDLGLEGQMQKQGTPTMGGLMIIAGIVIPTLLFARLNNVYILLLLASTLWLGAIGFIDDYIKVFKKDKGGLAGTSKIIGQIGIGVVVGLTVYFHPSIRTKVEIPEVLAQQFDESEITRYQDKQGGNHFLLDRKSPNTTIPFIKDNEFNYSSILKPFGKGVRDNWTWLVYVLAVIFIITAVSNGANITDGIDGLAAGTSAVIVLTLGILTYIGGNIMFSQYLDVMYIPGIGELVVFIGAMLGACIGFLWYNTYPAQVFMGDTGSLALGGAVGAVALLLKSEFLLLFVGALFFAETASVIIQRTVFKYRRKKYGLEYAQKHRVFRRAPLHHHFEMAGWPETQVVIRFW